MFENDPCEIRTPDADLIASGRVVSVADDELVVDVEGSVDGRTVPPQVVHIKIRSQVKGECTYLAEIIGGQLNFLHVVLDQLLDVVQLRGSVREPVDLDYVIDRWLETGAPAKPPAEAPERTEITVLDLSAEGMLFATDIDIPIGAQFVLTFTHTRSPIELIAEVLRREQGGNRPRYGCRFVGISERASDEIFRFILEQQRSRRRGSLTY